MKGGRGFWGVTFLFLATIGGGFPRGRLMDKGGWLVVYSYILYINVLDGFLFFFSFFLFSAGKRYFYFALGCSFSRPVFGRWIREWAERGDVVSPHLLIRVLR